MRVFVFALLAIGCTGSELAPSSVAPPWASRSLSNDPDIVLSVDMQGVEHDAFFGRLFERLMAETPEPLDAVRPATRIDLFANAARKSIVTVVHGVSDTAAVGQCFHASKDVGFTAAPGAWIVTFGNTANVGGVPTLVHMDSGALFEAWLGPGAFDEALRRGAGEKDMWRHLVAVRVIVRGGDTPSFTWDARFETPVDAEHAANDLARLDRLLRHYAEEAKESQQANVLIEQLGKVRVQRDGSDLAVSVQLTPAITRYVLDALGESHRSHRPSCD
jgi:hypothetical protein